MKLPQLLYKGWPWFADAVALELEVTPKNTRARALYRRLGFSPYPNAMFRLRR